MICCCGVVISNREQGPTDPRHAARNIPHLAMFSLPTHFSRSPPEKQLHLWIHYLGTIWINSSDLRSWRRLCLMRLPDVDLRTHWRGWYSCCSRRWGPVRLSLCSSSRHSTFFAKQRMIENVSKIGKEVSKYKYILFWHLRDTGRTVGNRKAGRCVEPGRLAYHSKQCIKGPFKEIWQHIKKTFK